MSFYFPVTHTVSTTTTPKARSSPTKRTMSDAEDLPAILSLFCGPGGLDLGFRKSGFKINLALDISAAAIRTHKANFPETDGIAADLIKLGPSGVLREMKSRFVLGQKIGVIGGPPCQGFSRANRNSNPNDPRNRMPQLYLEIVQELQKFYSVEFIIFENVLGIRDRKHAHTYLALLEGMATLGFEVNEKEYCALDFGVPQMRRRVILTALKASRGYLVTQASAVQGKETVYDAIGGMSEPIYFRRNLNAADFQLHANHWTMNPKSLRFSAGSVQPLKKTRSFKLLKWDEPSPTIAFGNREIHVHPNGHRRLSIFEAMLLQGFPKSYVLKGNLSEQVQQVSNAVPPPLAEGIAKALRTSLHSIR